MILRTASLLLFAFSPEQLTLDRVTALAKVYFRDSAEVPMLVDVTTVVTDEKGKVTHRGHSTVDMVFNGYNQQSGNFTVRAKSGLFRMGTLRDSLSGEVAAFFAAGSIVKRVPTRSVTVEPASVVVSDKDCPALQMVNGASFPKNLCGTGRFQVGPGANGDLMFQQFVFDTSGSPAMAKVPHLGEVQLKGFHADLTFQQGTMPGDAKPYLWPKETVTSLHTDKGTVIITNLYRPKT